MVEVDPAGVPVRRAVDIIGAPRGVKATPSAISEPNKAAFIYIEDRRNSSQTAALCAS